jgi:branched-chain amino acid transport system substrate-binding protein
MSDGSISRRDFLKYAGLAGASIAAAGGLGGLLAACGGGETTTTAATTATTSSGPATTGATTATTAAQSTTTVSASGEKKSFTVGAIAFLTGPAAAGGAAAKAGWELAVSHVNDAGGIKIGADTYTVKLQVEDDAMSVDQAATAAQKLIQQDEAKVLVGPLIDAFKNVILPIANQGNVLYSSCDTCNGSAKITYDGNTDVSPQKSLYIRAHWANDEVTPYLLDYLQKNYATAKKIAVCGITENCTQGLYDWSKDVFAARGLERVADLEQVAPDASDLNPPVQRLLSAKPDAIWVAMSGPTTWGFVTKSAREQGFKGPVFCSTHLDVDFANTVAGGGNVDMFGAGVCLKDLAALPPAMQKAHQEYVDKGYPAKDEIADIYLVGYNGLWVTLQAVMKAGSLDAQAIYDAYSKMTNPGDIQTLWGDGAYVGGLQNTGVNVVLNEPYWIDAIGADGVSHNVQQIFVKVP